MVDVHLPKASKRIACYGQELVYTARRHALTVCRCREILCFGNGQLPYLVATALIGQMPIRGREVMFCASALPKLIDQCQEIILSVGFCGTGAVPEITGCSPAPVTFGLRDNEPASSEKASSRSSKGSSSRSWRSSKGSSSRSSRFSKGSSSREPKKKIVFSSPWVKSSLQTVDDAAEAGHPQAGCTAAGSTPALSGDNGAKSLIAL